MPRKKAGRLIIIGGAETREPGERRLILEEVAKGASSKGGKLLIVTVATEMPEEVAQEYIATFKDLGVGTIEVLDVRTREEAMSDESLAKLEDVDVIFFTGGDQLRITSQIGDTPIFQTMRDMVDSGCTVAGTSAGAAAMSETMIVNGSGDISAKVSGVDMAPGLALLSHAVIDSHFAERGRIGRLLSAVAQNPRTLGIGIDEDTAIVVEGQRSFRVLGEGAVYVVDGSRITFSSLAEHHAEGTLAMFDVCIHVLSEGYSYDLIERRPIAPEIQTTSAG